MKTRTVVVLATMLAAGLACEAPGRCTVVIHDATHDTSWVGPKGDTLYRARATVPSAMRSLRITTVSYRMGQQSDSGSLKAKSEVAKVCAVYDTVHSPR